MRIISPSCRLSHPGWLFASPFVPLHGNHFRQSSISSISPRDSPPSSLSFSFFVIVHMHCDIDFKLEVFELAVYRLCHYTVLHCSTTSLASHRLTLFEWVSTCSVAPLDLPSGCAFPSSSRSYACAEPYPRPGVGATEPERYLANLP